VEGQLFQCTFSRGVMQPPKTEHSTATRPASQSAIGHDAGDFRDTAAPGAPRNPRRKLVFDMVTYGSTP